MYVYDNEQLFETLFCILYKLYGERQRRKLSVLGGVSNTYNNNNKDIVLLLIKTLRLN